MNLQNRLYVLLFLFVLTLLFVSCGSLNLPYSKSWYASEGKIKRNKGAISLLSVQVDKAGARDSIEREIEGLAPLIFWENGYCWETDSILADYTVDIRAREREYSMQWKTKRSISLEVRIWDNGNFFLDSTVTRQALPVAAGKVVVTVGSLSSSQAVESLLSQAIKKAVRRLGNGKRGK